MPPQGQAAKEKHHAKQNARHTRLKAKREMSDLISVRMGAKLSATMKETTLASNPPMNPHHHLELTKVLTYIMSQDNCHDLPSAHPYGEGRDEVATKAYHTSDEITHLLKTEGKAETAFNIFALNPYWTPVPNVPYNRGSLRALKQCYKINKWQFNNYKFHCYCQSKTFDPYANMGDVKVFSPLEPLHAAVMAFRELHEVGMTSDEFDDWMKLFRSMTCIFTVIDSPQENDPSFPLTPLLNTPFTTNAWCGVSGWPFISCCSPIIVCWSL